MSTVKLKFFSQGYYNGNGEMTSVKYNQDQAEPKTAPIYEVETATATIWAGATAVETQTATWKTDGTAEFEFSHEGDYIISVSGVNTLEVFTPSALTLGDNPLEYDFTVDASQAFGSNQAEVETGVFALYSGDVNQDGTISEADRALWNTDSDNALFGTYPTDLNGDGRVDPIDFTILEPNLGKSVMRP